MEQVNFDKYSINCDNMDLATVMAYIEAQEETVTAAQTRLQIAWERLGKLTQ